MNELPPLPHLVADDPNKRSKKAILAIIVLSIMVISLPVGVYLAQQRTQVSTRADTEVSSQPAIILEQKTNLNAGPSEILVDVSARSNEDSINLVIAKINFDPNILRVTKIASSSALPKHMEAQFDNSSGQISIISGVPTPGIKTDAALTDNIAVATVYFEPKVQTTTTIKTLEDSQLLRDLDNLNVLKQMGSLDLDINQSTVASSPLPQAQNMNAFPILQPQGGGVYSYFKNLEITWNPTSLTKVSGILVYENGQLFGSVANNISNTGKFSWSPSQTLLLPYVQNENYFQIEIVGTEKGSNREVKSLSEPFGLSVDDITVLPKSDLSTQNFTITDSSRQMSNFLITPVKDEVLDLNGDSVINDLDFWLLKQQLVRLGLIK